MAKKRTIEEYRQVKDSVYLPPKSHYNDRLNKVKKEVLEVFLASHTKLFKCYEEEDRKEILSLIENVIVKLDKR